MYLADWLRILLRRWYVLLPALVLTATGAVMTSRAVQPSYEATSTLLLLQPPDPQLLGPQNPYLRFGGALPVVANVLAQTMSGEAAQASIKAQGARGLVTVAAAPGRSPMVVVTADAPTVAEARRTMGVAVTTLNSELSTLQKQANAPAQTWVTAQLIATNDPTVPVRRAQIRAVLAVAAVGLAGSLVLVVLFETVARSVARRRLRRRPGPGGTTSVSRPGRTRGDSAGTPRKELGREAVTTKSTAS